MDVSKTNNVELDNEKIMEGFRKSKKEAEETIKDEQKTKEKLKAGEEKLNKIGDKNNVIGKLFDDIKLLFEMVGAKDKTFKLYEGLKHEVYNELAQDRIKVLQDLRLWLDAHV